MVKALQDLHNANPLRGEAAHKEPQTIFLSWVTTNDFGPEFSSAMR
jgi:hypothetical protein